MDGSVGPDTDGSTSAAAHNVDGVTTKPPENAPLTAAQLREKAVVARGLVATDRKARVSFSFTTLTNGAVTTAPKHACKMPHCYPDHVSPRKAAAAKKPASKPAATKKAASKPAATKKEATKKPKSVSPPEHN